MSSPSPTDRGPEAGSARADLARFLRLVTHDLRQPIAATRTIVSVLADGYAGPLLPKQADLVGRLERRLEFMQALVDDLIDLAAAAVGSGPDAVSPRASLAAEARKACERAGAAARAAGVGLECGVADEPLSVEAREADLALVLDQLIGNAVKYAAGGHVRVRVERDGNSARAVVADTGIGIPDKARPLAFEAFFRAPNAKSVDPQGTGLGLAIVKAIADRCGWDIGLDSAEGRGTTVTVRLPLAPA
jgi:signal transduction histidine kinase